jgi:hypothetical protein
LVARNIGFCAQASWTIPGSLECGRRHYDASVLVGEPGFLERGWLCRESLTIVRA